MSIFDIYPIYRDWCLLRDARPPKPLSILGVGQGALEENRPVATHCTRAKLMGLIADLGAALWAWTPSSSSTSSRTIPWFLPLLEPLFKEVDNGRRELVTSALTLLAL